MVVVYPQSVVYVIVEVPFATAVTTPVDPTTVATAVLLLVHVPPPVASASVLVPGFPIKVVPVIAAGATFTVAVVVTKQLPAK